MLANVTNVSMSIEQRAAAIANHLRRISHENNG